MSQDDLVGRLERELPEGTISRDAGDLAEYGKDWTKVYAPAPCAIALPRTTAEVAHILAFCNDSKLAVVPSGGRTGLAGGAMAAKG